jgi:hypothetical protein
VQCHSYLLHRHCVHTESGFFRCFENAPSPTTVPPEQVDITNTLETPGRCRDKSFAHPVGKYGTGFDKEAFALAKSPAHALKYSWGWTSWVGLGETYPARTCSVDDPTCFDLKRPACGMDPIPVYLYSDGGGGATSDEFRQAVESGKRFVIVESPDNACLLITGIFNTCDSMHPWDLPFWNSGTNHIIFNPCQHRDWVAYTFDVGNAAVIGRSLYGPSFRPDYDIQLASLLAPGEHYPPRHNFEQSRILNVNRTVLLSLQGGLPDGDTWERSVWYGHRYLAVRFLHNPEKAIYTYSNNEQPCHKDEFHFLPFDQMVLESRVVLCFGGCGGF